MSLEAWGDEGNVATCWEDTAMRQDFDRVSHAFLLWKRNFRNEFPGPEFEAAIDAIDTALDEAVELMSGKNDNPNRKRPDDAKV